MSHRIFASSMEGAARVSPPQLHAALHLRSSWRCLCIKDVTATTNGLYFFQFEREEAIEEVIYGASWLFQGQPIVLQWWELGMVLRKHKHTQPLTNKGGKGKEFMIYNPFDALMTIDDGTECAAPHLVIHDECRGLERARPESEGPSSGGSRVVVLVQITIPGGCWVEKGEAGLLRYLRLSARYIITEEDALLLFKPVTANEFKMVFLEIAEDKSSGLDEYPSGFYKVGWSVMGDEVMRATLEFFSMAKLLKPVNTTLLIFIPKELFTGNNQQQLPQRYAFNVDLQKAYDTMEWDFLLAVLHLFGFPPPFIHWIEECVTTSAFSVCINGIADGFFLGARGLR
ncbi:UNVERIFIED_CONTAM: hypothetical protein Sradi_3331200 [Sesamum radiatum]|uniref:DUF4283 domain-containing protein n=1 Tax=Sesamum radiatum TaxID=300843 RepID=A0AAW2R2C0_SESRA